MRCTTPAFVHGAKPLRARPRAGATGPAGHRTGCLASWSLCPSRLCQCLSQTLVLTPKFTAHPTNKTKHPQKLHFPSTETDYDEQEPEKQRKRNPGVGGMGEVPSCDSLACLGHLWVPGGGSPRAVTPCERMCSRPPGDLGSAVGQTFGGSKYNLSYSPGVFTLRWSRAHRTFSLQPRLTSSCPPAVAPGPSFL